MINFESFKSIDTDIVDFVSCVLHFILTWFVPPLLGETQFFYYFNFNNFNNSFPENISTQKQEKLTI